MCCPVLNTCSRHVEAVGSEFGEVFWIPSMLNIGSRPVARAHAGRYGDANVVLARGKQRNDRWRNLLILRGCSQDVDTLLATR